MTYGERLKYARKLRNISQDQLVSLSDVSQASISKIERDDQKRSSFDLPLAKALNINPEWLRTGEGDIEGYIYSGSLTEVDGKPADPEKLADQFIEKHMLADYQALPPSEQRKKFDEIVEFFTDPNTVPLKDNTTVISLLKRNIG